MIPFWASTAQIQIILIQQRVIISHVYLAFQILHVLAWQDQVRRLHLIFQQVFMCFFCNSNSKFRGQKSGQFTFGIHWWERHLWHELEHEVKNWDHSQVVIKIFDVKGSKCYKRSHFLYNMCKLNGLFCLNRTLFQGCP